MRAALRVFVLASLVLGGCSDDDDNGGDAGTVDQAPLTDQVAEQPLQQDKGPPGDKGPADKGPVSDKGPAGDKGPVGDKGNTDAITTSNSGAICTVSNPTCPSPDEKCTYFDVSTGKGMCLGKCANQGDPCAVNDKTQLSVCSTKGLDGKWYCGWFCEWGGKTYKCPNDTDYKCVTVNSAKFCHPK